MLASRYSKRFHVLSLLLLVISSPVIALEKPFYDENYHYHQVKHHHETIQEKQGRLGNSRAKEEIKHLKSSFKNLDLLFDNMTIRSLGPGHKKREHSSLGHFLRAPHDPGEIFAILEKHMGNKLTDPIRQEIASLPDLSFYQAVSFLWKKKYLTRKESQDLITQQVRITPDEIIRLFENGIAQTNSGYLVELRTGSTWGDTLKLDDTIYEAMKIRNASNKRVLDLESPKCISDEALQKIVASRVNDGSTDHAVSTITDAHIINLIRTHFLSYAANPTNTWFRPPSGTAATVVNPVNNMNFMWTPSSLSAIVIANHYFTNINASTYHSVNVDPVGLFYTGSLNFANGGPSWSIRYSDGYLGAGAVYTTNISGGTWWSNGQPTFVSVGGSISGWEDRLTVGVNFQTMAASSTYLGGQVAVTVSRFHDTKLLEIVPLDAKIKSIRGLYKVEINDNRGIGLAGGAAVNFSPEEVPVTVAFRANADYTKKSLFRTHVPLQNAQKIIAEGGYPGLLYILGKKAKASKIPSFQKPENLKEGDELVQVKIGTLWGGFLVGLESLIPIHAARIGASLQLTAEYTLGLKRWPNNKFEVSIEPTHIIEGSLFESSLNIFGAGQALGAALAKKQIFMFDFNNPHAKLAYKALVKKGQLPNRMKLEAYCKDRGAEYLLAHFRAQNEILEKIGVQRTHLEKVVVDSSKIFAGVNAPIVPATIYIINKVDKHTRKSKKRLNLKYEGLDIGLMRTDTESIITNGLISVVMQTYGGRVSEGQGFSGRYNEDLFVTHRRVHTTDASGNDIWQFDSLTMSARFSDTIITGGQENSMVDKINHLFGTDIDYFEIRDSKQPRIVDIERTIAKKELLILARLSLDDVARASQISGVSAHSIQDLLHDLRGQHPDKQGLRIKGFLEKYNLMGFSALHMLLGGLPEEIKLKTQAGYEDTINRAQTFILRYSNASEKRKHSLVNFTAKDSHDNRKTVKNFYRDARGILRDIDVQLRLLHDDKFLLDEHSSMVNDYGTDKIKEIIRAGIRQDKEGLKNALIDARKTLLEMMDLEAQKCSAHKRLKIYDYAQDKNLHFRERMDRLRQKYARPISAKEAGSKIRERIQVAATYIKQIDERLLVLGKYETMKEMDPGYVLNFTKELEDYREELLSMVAFHHLSDKEKARVWKKVRKRSFFSLPPSEEEKDIYRNLLKHDEESAEVADEIVEEREVEMPRSRSLNHETSAQIRPHRRPRSMGDTDRVRFADDIL
jgi:hypothetical protein